MRRTTLLLALLLACKSTPEKQDAEAGGKAKAGANDEITIPPDALEPMNDFVMNTRRIVAAEFVRIEISAQYFEERMGTTRDFRYVDRTVSTLADGTRVVRLLNRNDEQLTNVDPELLPRVFFGQGLELRAYREIRIYLRDSRKRERPLFLDVQCRSASENVRVWVNGRLEYEQPKVFLRSELLWNEDKERYVHKAGVE